MKRATSVISVRLPEETVKAIDELARQHRRSRSWIVNEAVRKLLADGGHFDMVY